MRRERQRIRLEYKNFNARLSGQNLNKKTQRRENKNENVIIGLLHSCQEHEKEKPLEMFFTGFQIVEAEEKGN